MGEMEEIGSTAAQAAVEADRDQAIAPVTSATTAATTASCDGRGLSNSVASSSSSTTEAAKEPSTAVSSTSAVPSAAAATASSSASSSSHNNSYSHMSKTGRKGDPRMHRAVQARLDDPTMSLWTALQLGGFLYEHDEDANLVDAENVTLGQRKNQLSRRLRLALKQQQQQQPQQQSSTATTTSLESSLLSNESVSGGGCCGHQKQHAFLDETAVFSIVGTTLAGHKRSLNSMSLERDLHPTKTPSTTALAAASTAASIVSPTSPPRPGSTGGATAAIASTTPAELHRLQQQPHGHGTMSSASSQSTNNSHAAAAAPSPLSTLSSLQETATSIGLTLDQLALALSTSNANHLSQVLTAAVTDSSTTSAVAPVSFKAAPHDLAVALYHCENRALYAKSMLLAGFDADVAHNETSTQYIQVALDAWQLEGRRLQALVKESKQQQQEHEKRNTAAAGSTNALENHNWHHYRSRDSSIDLSCVSVSSSTAHGIISDMNKEQQHHHHDSHSRNNGTSNQSSAASLMDRPAAAAGGGGGRPKLDRDHNGDVAQSHPPQQQQQQQQQPRHTHKSSTNTNTSEYLECVNETNRHIHRLGGKCGHVPILHQPAGGLPHIDFVVGDRVECYQDLQALSQDHLLWPSSFCCEDLSCPESCRDEIATTTGTTTAAAAAAAAAAAGQHNHHGTLAADHKQQHPTNQQSKDATTSSAMTATAAATTTEHKHSAECIIGGDPKVFDLNELNLDGAEWNLDFTNGDSLLGLFKLAEQ